MDGLLKQGMSIILVSSELPEISSMSDRVAVMRDGAITAMLDRSEATQERIMQYSVTV
jgi:ABC-type sugar transport system ATPase subunit